MNQPPLVSICIPAFNAEATIGETINSIVSQNYPNFDIIVSDNNSTDKTPDIVKQYALKDNKVRYTINELGRPDWAEKMPHYIGAYENMNYVLKQGRGDYLCLFHADDLYEPDIVRKQMMLMEAYPKVGAVFTMARYIDEYGRHLALGCTQLPKGLRGKQVFNFETLINAILKHSNFLPAPSVMIRRKTLERVGWFNERQFLTSADLEMWLRIAQKSDIGIIDEPLLNYRVSLKQFGSQYHRQRITLSNFFKTVDHFISLPEIKRIVSQDAINLYEMERGADYIICAMKLLVQGCETEAREYLDEGLNWMQLVTALCHRPRRLRILLPGMALWASTRLGLGSQMGNTLQRVWDWHTSRGYQPRAKLSPPSPVGNA